MWDSGWPSPWSKQGKPYASYAAAPDDPALTALRGRLAYLSQGDACWGQTPGTAYELSALLGID
jgi:hypothetical protein